MILRQLDSYKIFDLIWALEVEFSFFTFRDLVHGLSRKINLKRAVEVHHFAIYKYL